MTWTLVSLMQIANVCRLLGTYSPTQRHNMAQNKIKLGKDSISYFILKVSTYNINRRRPLRVGYEATNPIPSNLPGLMSRKSIL